jgi:hypothetical protein
VSQGQAALVRRVVGSLFRRRARQTHTVGADATWQALQAVNRINRAHWQAQQAMRTEAARWQNGRQ